MKSIRTPRVFLVCTGLGRINRGYESFTRECYDAIKDTKEFELYLLKGGGNRIGKELPIFNLHRNHALAKFLGKMVKKNSYLIEQFTFFLSMTFKIVWYRPALIYYSDFLLGTYLWHFRRLTGINFKLLFSNGAPNNPPFTRMDHVQQLLPLYVDIAVSKNAPIEMQTLLPYAIDFKYEKALAKVEIQKELREKLGLPIGKKIILSVGAINSYHKRMDYLVSEFKAFDQDEYFLVLLGQIEEESEMIFEKAERVLSPGSYLIKQVSKSEVNDYLFAADFFILASFSEGQPRVLLEAMSAGLMPIVHDYPVTRQTLKGNGNFRDLRVAGELMNAINDLNKVEKNKKTIIMETWETYSWEKLTFQYNDMILRVMA